MGRQDDVLDVEQRRVLGQGLLGEGVERGARENAVVDRLGERVLVDDAAAGAVDEVAALQLGQLVFADHPLGLGEERRVDRREVAAAERLVEVLDQLGAEPVGALLGDVRVVDDEIHPERVEPLGDLLTDATEADDGQRLVVHFGAEELPFRPLAAEEAAVCLRDRARDGERHRDRVLGGGPDVPFGALATMTPWSVAASMSMLSTPMPARPTMTSSEAASNTASFTSVPERTISALASLTASSSASPSTS